MLKSPLLFGLFFFCATLKAQVNTSSDSVMFVSKDERIAWQWTDLVFVDEFPPSETGGMGQNWDVSIGHWTNSEWRLDWCPLNLDHEHDGSLADLLNYTSVLNAIFYNVDSLNRLTTAAGEGYGTFDHTEFRYFGDSVVLSITDCVGHCSGSPPTKYERFTFDAQGWPLVKVTYPLDYSYSYPFDEQAVSLHLVDSALNVLANGESEHADTTIFQNNANVHGRHCSWREVQDVGLYIQQVLSENGKEEHQIYISNEPMESIVSRRFGYSPRLLVFELYQNGAVYFWWNARTGKYYYCGVHGADGLLVE